MDNNSSQKSEVKFKVLVCEDDDGILGLCDYILKDAGYDVVTLEDSNQIFDLIEVENPDILLIDLWMSGLAGDEIVKRLKSDPYKKNIPVIIFSANNEIEAISKSVGADDYLPKPFSIIQLEDMVKKHIQISAKA